MARRQPDDGTWRHRPVVCAARTRPTVRGGDCGDDRQAEAGAAATTALSRGVRAVEAFEDPFRLLVVEAGTVVTDLDHAARGPARRPGRCRRRPRPGCPPGCAARRCPPGWSPPGAGGPRRRSPGPTRGLGPSRPTSEMRRGGRMGGRFTPGAGRCPSGAVRRRRPGRAGASMARRVLDRIGGEHEQVHGLAPSGPLSSSRASSSRSSTSAPIRRGLVLDPAPSCAATSSGRAPRPGGTARRSRGWRSSGVRSSWRRRRANRRVRASDASRGAERVLDLGEHPVQRRGRGGRPRCARARRGCAGTGRRRRSRRRSSRPRRAAGRPGGSANQPDQHAGADDRSPSGTSSRRSQCTACVDGAQRQGDGARRPGRARRASASRGSTRSARHSSVPSAEVIVNGSVVGLGAPAGVRRGTSAGVVQRAGQEGRLGRPVDRRSRWRRPSSAGGPRTSPT